MNNRPFKNVLAQKKFTFPKLQKRYSLPPKNALFAKRDELKQSNEQKIYRRRETRKDWEKLSKDFLATHPFCVACYKKGILTKATETEYAGSS